MKNCEPSPKPISPEGGVKLAQHLPCTAPKDLEFGPYLFGMWARRLRRQLGCRSPLYRGHTTTPIAASSPLARPLPPLGWWGGLLLVRWWTHPFRAAFGMMAQVQLRLLGGSPSLLVAEGHLLHPQLVEGALMVQQQSPLLLVLHSGPRAIVDKSV
jgi:hypothetical protein